MPVTVERCKQQREAESIRNREGEPESDSEREGLKGGFRIGAIEENGRQKQSPVPSDPPKTYMRSPMVAIPK